MGPWKGEQVHGATTNIDRGGTSLEVLEIRFLIYRVTNVTRNSAPERDLVYCDSDCLWCINETVAWHLGL